MTAELKSDYVFKMTDCSSSHFLGNRARLQIVQLIPMETWNQADLFPCLHDLYTRFALKEVFFTKYVDKSRRYFIFKNCLLDCGYLALNYVLCLLGLGLSFRNGVGSAKCADYCQFIFVFWLCDLNGLQHFHLVLGIQTVSRFDL